MRLLLGYADRDDLGVTLELEAMGEDPLNPYDLGSLAWEGQVAKSREA